jgi:C1A family cysteine protease
MSLPISATGRSYGFRPSHADPKIPKFKVSLPVAIPPTTFLANSLGPVKDQGQLGSCTAFAATGYLEYLYRRFKTGTPVFSPLFLYYKEREFDGDLGQGDTGSFGSTAFWVLHNTGVCLESTDPYNTSDYENAPTAAQITEAAKYRVGAMHTVSSVDDIKHCIASQYPVLIGVSIYESFESGDWGGNWTMPAPSGSLLGGHEIYIHGYDDNNSRFTVRNSWGETWGNKGDFYLPYNLLEGILTEARILHFGVPWRG